MIGKLLATMALSVTLAAPVTTVYAQSADEEPAAGADLSDLERGLREFEGALERLRELADEEAIARAQALARDLKREFTDRAEELAREGADRFLRTLDELIDAIPQYQWPEITEDGDIILRRVPPGERRKARPEGDEEFDET